MKYFSNFERESNRLYDSFDLDENLYTFSFSAKQNTGLDRFSTNLPANGPNNPKG